MATTGLLRELADQSAMPPVGTSPYPELEPSPAGQRVKQRSACGEATRLQPALQIQGLFAMASSKTRQRQKQSTVFSKGNYSSQTESQPEMQPLCLTQTENSWEPRWGFCHTAVGVVSSKLSSSQTLFHKKEQLVTCFLMATWPIRHHIEAKSKF